MRNKKFVLGLGALGILLILGTILFFANRDRTLLIGYPPNETDVTITNTGAILDEEFEISDQLTKLKGLVPYQNEYFLIELTDTLPMYKVTLLQGYDSSIQNFTDWLLSNELDQLYKAQFNFVVQ